MNSSVYRRQWDVNSFTNPRKTAYKVSERLDGAWECSCPAWTMNMPRKNCKHIKVMQEAAGVVRAEPVPQAVTDAVTSAATAGSGSNKDSVDVIFNGYTIRTRRDLDVPFDATAATGAKTTTGRGRRKL